MTRSIRLTQLTFADSSTMSYTYDAGDRLTQIVDSTNGTITRTFDGLDQLTEETTPQGTVDYTYDDDGQRASMTVAGQTAVSYTYDGGHRLTAITQGTASVTVTHDNANRRATLTYPNGILATYGYDNANQLTSLAYTLSGNPVGDLTYTYDLAGNRTSVGGSWARTGLPSAVTGATYDAANRLTTWDGASLSYDLNGNLTSDGLTSYTWNARDQLAALSGSNSATFAYDARGRRRSKTVIGTTTNYLYDGPNFVQELSGSTPIANMLTGLGIDEVFRRTDSAGARDVLTDALGSTLELADGSGALQTHYTFESFGATTASGAASTNAQQFTGRENDATGLYYYRARYYSPNFQRFLSEDPRHSPTFLGPQCQASDTPDPSQYGEFDRGLAPLLALGFPYVARIGMPLTVNSQQLDLYAYAENDPTNKVDPTGLVAGPQKPGCDYIYDFNPCMTSCCNDHDRCYQKAQSRCDMWSLIETADDGGYFYSPECRECNNEAVRCIARSFIPGRRKDCGK